MIEHMTRNEDDTPEEYSSDESGASKRWLAGDYLVDRAGEFRELDGHGSRNEIFRQCHAWEGQDHE